MGKSDSPSAMNLHDCSGVLMQNEPTDNAAGS